MQMCAGLYVESNGMPLRKGPQIRSRAFSTRDRVLLSSNRQGRGMFPGLRCNGAAVDSAGMCACV